MYKIVNIEIKYQIVSIKGMYQIVNIANESCIWAKNFFIFMYSTCVFSPSTPLILLLLLHIVR